MVCFKRRKFPCSRFLPSFPVSLYLVFPLPPSFHSATTLTVRSAIQCTSRSRNCRYTCWTIRSKLSWLWDGSLSRSSRSSRTSLCKFSLALSSRAWCTFARLSFQNIAKCNRLRRASEKAGAAHREESDRHGFVSNLPVISANNVIPHTIQCNQIKLLNFELFFSTDVYLYAIDPHLNVMIDMDTLHR